MKRMGQYQEHHVIALLHELDKRYEDVLSTKGWGQCLSVFEITYFNKRDNCWDSVFVSNTKTKLALIRALNKKFKA